MDDKLSRALRTLPRERARPGFTDRVLRRIEDAETPSAKSSRPSPWRWPLIAAAGAACLLALTTGAKDWWYHHQQQQGLARLASIEDERRALLLELEALQQQVAQARPRIYVGGTNDVDFILDVDRLRNSDDPHLRGLPGDATRLELDPSSRVPPGSRTPGIRPASFNPGQPTIY